ncbi:helix-turn-helix transcriptional regulator [Massilia soli]|uniref:AlpA family transcriptional regulator n=1 Tax=Massilia soli TaxID=2792854 RepID=A0ABS7STQ5_9BURK|nr:AlpA family phage regulatory protein [Massilia soli]MBZ2209324.1 AlpA family transcriptional regulator [Massilia soli]
MKNTTTAAIASVIPGKVIISRRQLLQKVPMCERTILDMEKRGEFPRRFAITPRLVGWDLDEVDEWIAKQKATAMQLASPGSGAAD